MAAESDIDSTLKLYTSLMIELKSRYSVLGATLSLKLPPRIAYETAMLQVRLICELLALSSLVAHGDILAAEPNLKRLWEPHKIIHKLMEIHPAFYPKPGKQVVKDGKVEKVTAIESGYLTKEELLQFWNRSGDVLHRGSIKKVNMDGSADFEDVISFGNRLIQLLNHHQIPLRDGRHQIWVLMNAEGTENVASYLFERTDP